MGWLFLIGLTVILIFEDHQFALYIAVGVLALWIFVFWVSSFFDEPPPPSRPIWRVVLKGLGIYTEICLWLSLWLGATYQVTPTQGDPFFPRLLVLIGVLTLLLLQVQAQRLREGII